MTTANPLVPPDAGEEQSQLITCGQCPIRVDDDQRQRAWHFCREPLADGLPVCSGHAEEYRTHVADQVGHLKASISRLEKELRWARGRVDRADERLARAREALGWYTANAPAGE